MNHMNHSNQSCFAFILLEVLQHGSWAQIQELEDLELIEIARQLPSTVLRNRLSHQLKSTWMLLDAGRHRPRVINSLLYQLKWATLPYTYNILAINWGQNQLQRRPSMPCLGCMVWQALTHQLPIHWFRLFYRA